MPDITTFCTQRPQEAERALQNTCETGHTLPELCCSECSQLYQQSGVLRAKLLKDDFSLQIAIAEQFKLFIRLPEALCKVREACP